MNAGCCARRFHSYLIKEFISSRVEAEVHDIGIRIEYLPAREGVILLPKLIALSLFVNDANVGPRVAAIGGHISRKALVPLVRICCVSVTCTQVYRTHVQSPSETDSALCSSMSERPRETRVRPACGLLRLNYLARVDDR